MAKIYPSIEAIEKFKVQPTEGEWCLINYLVESLSDDVEIYFQPFLNGDRPDVILMQRGHGIAIIEVKDWNLDYYEVREDNKWYVKKNNQIIKSPYQQVFGYKHNLFTLHINGLLDKKIKNNNFYKIIKPFVYFHNSTKKSVDIYFSGILEGIKSEISGLNIKYKKSLINFDKYNSKIEFLYRKKSNIERDKYSVTISQDTLNKIEIPNYSKSKLFEDSIYNEFKRYLNPPYHAINDGVEIIYEKKQAELIKSEAKHQKIKGVAGSGKTVVLAKRAVNAHKRHNDDVLILTFNLTLRSYIHDKISDVRENFSWKHFYITNYHQLISQTLNNLEIAIDLPKGVSDQQRNIMLDSLYYSNINVFDGYTKKINKYKSIFVDEIQVYIC